MPHSHFPKERLDFLKDARKIVQKTKDIAKLRGLLEEIYSKTGRTQSIPIAMEFEYARSLAIQRTYEILNSPKGDEWISELSVHQEIQDAKRIIERYFKEHPVFRLLIDLSINQMVDIDLSRIKEFQLQALNLESFLGSYRKRTNGLGYAVSARKVYSPNYYDLIHNQDRFVLFKEGETRVLAVLDGLGSYQYSAIASHYAAKRLEELKSELTDPTKINALIIKIHFEITNLLNRFSKPGDDAFLMNNGSTTLFMCVWRADDLILKYIGDSSTFLRMQDKRISKIGGDKMPGPFRNYVRFPLGAAHEFSDELLTRAQMENIHTVRVPGVSRVVLASDGLTDRVVRVIPRLRNVYYLSEDSVLVAERLFRKAVLAQMVQNQNDDITIVVSE